MQQCCIHEMFEERNNVTDQTSRYLIRVKKREKKRKREKTAQINREQCCREGIFDENEQYAPQQDTM